MNILVLKNKDDDSYYGYEDSYERNAIALSILRERFEMNWYSTEKEVRAQLERELNRAKNEHLSSYGGELTPEELSSLPEKLREAYEKELAKYTVKAKKLEADYGDELNFASWLEELLELPLEKALKATFRDQHKRRFYRAWYLMELRRDHEYEGYSIVTLDEPKELTLARELRKDSA